MKIKKIGVLTILFTFLLSISKIEAADEKFLDNNALTYITNSNNIVVAEANTGKIIAKKMKMRKNKRQS